MLSRSNWTVLFALVFILALTATAVTAQMTYMKAQLESGIADAQ